MSEKIRIAEVFNMMDSGGVESVVMNYCRQLDRDKIQLDFYFNEKSSLPQRAELEKMGVSLHPIPSYTRVIKYQKALVGAFKEGGFSAVHSHLSTMSVFTLRAAKKAGVPVRICHNHSTANRREGAKSILKYILRPFCGVFATHLFACGDYAAQWMYGKKRCESGEVYIMPNAIDTKKYAFSEQLRKEYREKFGIPKDAFVIGNVGRFMAVKNHSFLLDIFKLIYEKNENAWLLLVGEGELFEQTRKKAQELGVSDRVVFTGVRGDVCNIYSAMDVFCLPSLYEGLPVVGLEVLANGLALVCSDEVTREFADKDTKFLPLGDPCVWAEALLSEKRGRDSRLSEKYDIKHQAKKLEEFYLSCANEDKA